MYCVTLPMKPENYRVGVPYAGDYVEIFNSQSAYYEGWNIGNTGALTAKKEPMTWT